MANSQYLDILLIAMVAGIILFRLYTVLGRRTGHESPPRETYGLERGQPPKSNAADNVVALPDRSAQRAEASIERPSDPVARGLLDIKLADTHFDADHFLAGARQAYEMIVTAFAAGDLATLRPLLSKEVYAAFEQGVRARDARQEKTDFTFVGFKAVKIAEAALKGRKAEIGIVFQSQHISVTRNPAGAVVDGDERAVREVNDHWTFARDTQIQRSELDADRHLGRRGLSAAHGASRAAPHRHWPRGGAHCRAFNDTAVDARCRSPDRLRLTPVSFADLPGWNDADPRAALAAFRRSCAEIAAKPPLSAMGGAGYAGTAGDWQGACRAIPARQPMPPARGASSRPGSRRWRSAPVPCARGLFTGYYEPELRASRTRHGPYQTPLYGLPDDLVTADLGQFREKWKGEKLAGQLDGNRLVPYPDRAAIDAGGLERAHVLVYAEDPVTAFFLHIQGSGRVRLDDGSVIRLAYAGANGRPYTAIGRTLIQQGELDRATVSLQTIRAWLHSHPDQRARGDGIRRSPMSSSGKRRWAIRRWAAPAAKAWR